MFSGLIWYTLLQFLVANVVPDRYLHNPSGLSLFCHHIYVCNMCFFNTVTYKWIAQSKLSGMLTADIWVEAVSSKVIVVMWQADCSTKLKHVVISDYGNSNHQRKKLLIWNYCRYEWQEAKDGQFGAINESGQWVGMVGEVLRGVSSAFSS